MVAASSTGYGTQRAFDNPAIETAIALVNEIKRSVIVLFFLRTSIPHASLRHSTFIFEGLIDAAKRLRDRGIDFIMRHAKCRAADEFGRLCEEISPAFVISDENPLAGLDGWRELLPDGFQHPFELLTRRNCPERAWGERPIYGKIRYMSAASTGRKFDSRAYIARWGG